jgi:hypothetical protein
MHGLAASKRAFKVLIVGAILFLSSSFIRL